MSHFLIYAARLQDAGVCSLWVSLGCDKNGTRLMHVSPDASTPRDLAAKFPTRTFELCGTDRLLEQLQDDMAYAEGGPTPEALAAAIERHPLAAADLRQWYADWLLNPPPTDEEIAAAEADVDDAMVQRVTQRTLGVMRGLEIARTRDAMKAPSGVQATAPTSDEEAYRRYADAPPTELDRRRGGALRHAWFDGLRHGRCTPQAADGYAVLQEVVKWALAGHITEKGVTEEAGEAIRAVASGVPERVTAADPQRNNTEN